MAIGFLHGAQDVQWLLDTHLECVPLPEAYEGFKSCVLQGSEDAPYAVNLYKDENPKYDDDYYRVKFINDGMTYCEACEYCGRTDKPYGGFIELD